MADKIKCACSSCGAKYRLPLEAQGRSARCKRCGQKFRVPDAPQSLEDTVMSWLAIEDDDEAPVQPRVISMPSPEDDGGESETAAQRMRGPIRLKRGRESDQAASESKQ